MIDVFVYGTLMTGEKNHHVVQPYLKVTQPGRIRGRMYDAGEWPGLVLDPDGQVIEGQWLTVTAAGLRVLDEFEDYYGENFPGNLFERKQVADLANGRSGWVYVWKDDRGCPEIPGGSWRAYRASR